MRGHRLKEQVFPTKHKHQGQNLVTPVTHTHTTIVEENVAKSQSKSEKDATLTKGCVVSISSKTKIKRLHLFGKCFRVPGVSYSNWIYMGMECPGVGQYDAHCKQCWRQTRPENDGESSSGHHQQFVGRGVKQSNRDVIVES